MDPVTAILASNVGSGVANIFGSIFGAKNQEKAAQQANAMIMALRQQGIDSFNKMYTEDKDALAPYLSVGSEAANKLGARMDDLTAPIEMSQEQLEQTPGYQWLMKQGLRGVTGQNVLRGLSGAQLKGSADFVKGLADTTYKTQFDMANINKTNAFNRLFQTAEAGRGAGTSVLNAAVEGGKAMLGSATAAGGQIANNLIGVGNAQAARDISIGNQIGGMISSAPYAPMVANRLYPNGFTGMYGSGDDATVPVGQSRWG